MNKKTEIRRLLISISGGVLILFIFLSFTACPDPPDTTECGSHQIEVNGNCECEEGYHWNEDQTKCLMDTTSHNFSWEIDTIGIEGSYLRDVTIVDENNIWVVGNIETDSGEYNAAHWDGEAWDLIKIQPQGYVQPIQCIYYFSENDIWFGQGGLPIQWNGIEYYRYTPDNSTHLGQPTIESIWGTSSSNIYFVGLNGSIVHYDGIICTEMESRTNVDLKDVDGTPDGEHVFAVGWKQSGENIVLEFTGDAWNELYYNELYLPTDSTYGRVTAVGVFGDTATFSTKAGLWKYNFISQSSMIIPSTVVKTYGLDIIDISGVYENDIIIVSLGARILHFNGMSWYRYENITDTFGFQNVYLNGGDIFRDFAIVVGYCCNGNHSIVVTGIR